MHRGRGQAISPPTSYHHTSRCHRLLAIVLPRSSQRSSTFGPFHYTYVILFPSIPVQIGVCSLFISASSYFAPCSPHGYRQLLITEVLSSRFASAIFKQYSVATSLSSSLTSATTICKPSNVGYIRATAVTWPFPYYSSRVQVSS